MINLIKRSYSIGNKLELEREESIKRLERIILLGVGHVHQCYGHGDNKHRPYTTKIRDVERAQKTLEGLKKEWTQKEIEQVKNHVIGRDIKWPIEGFMSSDDDSGPS